MLLLKCAVPLFSALNTVTHTVSTYVSRPSSVCLFLVLRAPASGLTGHLYARLGRRTLACYGHSTDEVKLPDAVG